MAENDELSGDLRHYLQLAGQTDANYLSLQQRIQSDLSFGRQLDQTVIYAAEVAQVPPDDLTRILSSGPNVQFILENDSLQAVRNYITPIDSAYRNRELELFGQSLSEKVTDTLKTGYAALKATEKAAFVVTPLPLEAAKQTIQKVGFPLAATALAARLPLAQPVIETAIRWGGDMVSAATGIIAGNSLAHFSSSVMQNVPNVLGAKAIAAGLGEAVTPVLIGAARQTGQLAGSVGTALITGNAILKSGQALATTIAQKGPRVFFAETWQRGQAVLSRAKAFTQSIANQITSIRSKPMSDANNGFSPADYDNAVARGITPETIAATGDISLVDAYGNLELVQTELNSARLRRETPGLEYPTQDADIARLESRLTEFQEVFEARLDDNIAQGKFVVPPLENQNTQPQPEIQPEYLSDLPPVVTHGVHDDDELQATEAIDETKGYEQSDVAPEVSNEFIAELESTSRPEPDVEFDESPEVEPFDVNNEFKDSETAPLTFDELKGSDLSKENMDYALSIEQQLSQRNIDTQRIEIFFNGESQFKIKDYSTTKNKLGNEAVELLKTALNDPANLNGEVLIKQGSKVLFHVKDGQVLRDPLRMVNESVRVEANTTTQALYQNASASVNSRGLQQIQDVSKNAYRAGAQSEQVLDMNRQYNPEYQKQVESIGADAVERVVAQAQTKVALEQQPPQVTQQAQQKLS